MLMRSRHDSRHFFSAANALAVAPFYFKAANGLDYFIHIDDAELTATNGGKDRAYQPEDTLITSAHYWWPPSESRHGR